MKVTTELALKAEHSAQEMGGWSFQMDEAKLYGFALSEHLAYEAFAKNGVEAFECGSNSDVYALLESNDAKLTTEAFRFIGIVTTGVARPLDGEGEAHRVRLFIVASREGVVNIVRFQNDANEELIDEGEATGSLADALVALFQ